MSDEKTTREIWLDYVIKLNDRHLLRKKAYGVTVWAICGLLGILLYRIIDTIPQLVKSPDFVIPFTLSFATLLNLSIALLIIIYGLTIFLKAPYDIRVKSTLQRFADPVNAFWGVIIHLLLLFFNLRAYLLANQILIPSWPYIIMAIYAATDLLIRIRKRIILVRKFRSLVFELPHLLEPASLSSKGKKTIAGLIALTFGVAFFFIPSIGIVHLFRHSIILSNLYILKLSIEITLFIYILFFLIYQLTEYLNESFLTDLERRIIVDNLSVEEIREALVYEFLGPTLSEWLYRMKTELDIKFIFATKVTEDAEKKLSELTNINKENNYETIKGRKKEIHNVAIRACNEYIKLGNKNLLKLQFLKEEDAFSDSAKDILTEVLNKIKEQSATIGQLCKKMKDLHDTIPNQDSLSS